MNLQLHYLRQNSSSIHNENWLHITNLVN